MAESLAYRWLVIVLISCEQIESDTVCEKKHFSSLRGKKHTHTLDRNACMLQAGTVR